MKRTIQKKIDTKSCGVIRVWFSDDETKVVETPWNLITGSAFVYRYKIHVDYNGRQTSFKYFGSIKQYQNGETMKADGLVFALYCFVSDAIAGSMSLKEFRGEFGYAKNSEELKAYRGCQKAAMKCEEINLAGDALYDLVNELNEMCN